MIPISVAALETLGLGELVRAPPIGSPASRSTLASFGPAISSSRFAVDTPSSTTHAI